MNLWKLFLTFLRFGFLAWGGPIAQINMIREELVEQKKWISKEKFKRVLMIYQALPGPEAHELCVYFGMIKANRIGAILAGLGFMLPGFVLMLLLSWLYVSLGNVILLWFAGIAPAVSALILRATHRISIHFLHNKFLISIAVITAILSICLQKIGTENTTIFSSKNLFFEGLKAGLLSFGGAYTMIPFLQHSLVGNYPQITLQSFSDGIALGSVIPAPLVIFGTYLGFIADGFKGALLMTAGIFLPAFSFTLIGHKHLENLLENRALHKILDIIAAAVCGLLAVTAFEIFLSSVWSAGIKNLAIFSVALYGFYLIKNPWAIPAIIAASALVGFFKVDCLISC